jgi:hypothetical protein
LRTLQDVYYYGSVSERAAVSEIVAILAGGNASRATAKTWRRAEDIWHATVYLFRSKQMANPEWIALDYLLATRCGPPTPELMRIFELIR